MKIKSYLDGSSENVLVTIAIGSEYLEKWERNVLPSWLQYAKQNDFSIMVVIDDLVMKTDSKYKKPTWQKLLIPKYFVSKRIGYKQIAYLDSDILINPMAPSIFKACDMNKINSTSLRKFLPYDYNKTLRKIALLRKTHIDASYPLDSGMFISLDKLYEYHNLAPQEDEFCAGLLVFATDLYADFMENCFNRYENGMASITNGGDQTHVNYHVQESGFYNRIDYKWQAIWSYEAANFYPFLFENQFKNLDHLNECIKSSLFNNYFLHFAGTWPESTAWTAGTFKLTASDIHFYSLLKKYEMAKLSGEPLGTISAPY